MQGCKPLPAARQEDQPYLKPGLGFSRLTVMCAGLGNLLARPGLLRLSRLPLGVSNEDADVRAIGRAHDLLAPDRNRCQLQRALCSAARIAGPLRGTRASLDMQKNVVLLGCAVRAGSPVVGIELGACFQRDVDVLAGAVWPVHEETNCPF